MSENSTRLQICGDLAHINLRGNPRDSGFVENAQEALAQSLPLEANRMTNSNLQIYWLGPDEWMIVTAEENRAPLLKKLEEALARDICAVNDLSGGQVALKLSGVSARNILAKGCTLDLHPAEFAVGDCAQSGLAKCTVVIGLLDDAPTFSIIVRSSYSDYLLRWLRIAGTDWGIEFQ